MKKKKFDWFLFYQDCLDRIGMTDPWVQLAFTGVLKGLGILLLVVLPMFILIKIFL